LAALIGALFMLAAPPCQGHRISTRSGPPPQGVSIPSLTHGQIVVIRDNLSATPGSPASAFGHLVMTPTYGRRVCSSIRRPSDMKSDRSLRIVVIPGGPKV
jgi:hypothetical protein